MEDAWANVRKPAPRPIGWGGGGRAHQSKMSIVDSFLGMSNAPLISSCPLWFTWNITHWKFTGRRNWRWKWSLLFHGIAKYFCLYSFWNYMDGNVSNYLAVSNHTQLEFKEKFLHGNHTQLLESMIDFRRHPILNTPLEGCSLRNFAIKIHPILYPMPAKPFKVEVL